MTVSIATIQRMVCAEFDVTLRGLLSHRRGRDVSRPRQAAFMLCRDLTTHSLPMIGQKFGKDHSTVLHGARNCARLMAADPAFAARVERVRDSVLEVDEPLDAPMGLRPSGVRVTFSPVKNGVSRETAEWGPRPERAA
jgi:hypothetical protein